ncbi:zinc-ribbon domain-containing protein [Bacteroides uniformis]|uniref:zinc-ribbon domain-containing protein n=1 Tax=Bacteroides uniformis TaxID=820 RepID=UPI00233E90CE|nr:zinc-ribbon domain-containing protein [Bacteroides uniformis]MDC1809374.1 zinc-ribbon domain-containing protein [Bacteroides uniformis]
MAFCGKCGQQVNEGVKFCPSCGAPMGVVQKSAPEPAFSKLNDTVDNTAQFTPQEIEEGKVMSILAYLGILVLVPILAGKESKYIRFHANQGLLLCLAWVVWVIADGILSAVLRAILWRGLSLWELYRTTSWVLDLVYLVIGVLAIIGIINVLNGRAKELPFIGKYRILK